ncbi:MAG: hypothetical protein QW751_00270 [Candidatus Aenigmatarchaeota archaeon]
MRNAKCAKTYILIILVLILLIFSGCIHKQASNQRLFGGKLITFRADLDEAAKVPVYPNETVLLATLRDPQVNWVYLAYIPNETENGFYAVTGYELAYKLTAAYKAMLGRVPAIRDMPLNETPQQPARDELIIWMRGPGAGANQTAVSVDRGIIIVEGPDFSEVNRTWTDLDLAADRLLMVMMELE